MHSRMIGYVALGVVIAPLCAWADDSAEKEPIDWSETPDFLELRMDIGSSDDYLASCEFYEETDTNEQIISHMEEEDWESATAALESRLQACPVDITLHMYAAFVLEELDRVEESQHHIQWFEGLMDSILESGDGRTSETAFVTISVSEGYAVMRAFGLQPKSQALTGDLRDQFVATDEAGEEHVIYFYPELHWERLSKMFGDDE